MGICEGYGTGGGEEFGDWWGEEMRSGSGLRLNWREELRELEVWWGWRWGGWFHGEDPLDILYIVKQSQKSGRDE